MISQLPASFQAARAAPGGGFLAQIPILLPQVSFPRYPPCSLTTVTVKVND